MITATEMIQKQAQQNRLNEFESILTIVEMASGCKREDIKFEIDTVFGKAQMMINIDEWYFEVDNQSFADWCRTNCVGDFNSDKWFTFEGLNGSTTK